MKSPAKRYFGMGLGAVFTLAVWGVGCGAAGETAADGEIERIREAPASFQSHGVAHYASRGDGESTAITLLSDSGDTIGTLSAAKDVAGESFELELALPDRHVALAKSKLEAVIKLNGREASFTEARPELEMARELLVEEGFFPAPDAPVSADNDASPALQSLVSPPDTQNAVCSNPLRSGCYRSSNQAWACAQAVPGSCLTGYCYESCSCYDDTQWYEWPWTVYVCCSSERCN